MFCEINAILQQCTGFSNQLILVSVVVESTNCHKSRCILVKVTLQVFLIFFVSNSQQPASLKDLLCELIGGNCCVNSLTCINHFVSPVMLQLMKLTSSFKQITNFPVPVIPQVEVSQTYFGCGMLIVVICWL